MRRIVILALSLVLSAAVAVAQGRAGDFPSQPLRLIIGFPPGSAADITARLVGAVMSDRLGQQVVVESRPGAGSSIAAEFVVRAKIKLVHVPYQGSPPAVTDLLAARVSMMLGVASTIMPHVEAGRLKALASSSAKRSHAAPNVPTMAEAGLPDFEAGVWFGLM